MMIFITLLLGVLAVNGCPLAISEISGSCCKVTSNAFKFSVSPPKSRVYNITKFCGDCGTVAEGYCDAITAGGGWLVIQRRQDGSEDFDRDWMDYEEGFGNLTGEFWYGLKSMHCLTHQGQWEMRIDYEITNGTKGYLSYSDFRVGPVTEQYPLTISGFSGPSYAPVTDPFGRTLWGINTVLNGSKFTTRDRDNDMWIDRNCAVDNWAGFNGGGWWYRGCSAIKINNLYENRRTINLNGEWLRLPFVEMKIRPKTCAI